MEINQDCIRRRAVLLAAIYRGALPNLLLKFVERRSNYGLVLHNIEIIA
jgi:hypothetical protein